MEYSIHDNWLYAQAVDHEHCTIILHTIYPHVDPPEYTDVIFEGVVVHHFEQQRVGGGPNPANVLFGIEESDPAFILGQYSQLLARTKHYGWPVFNYDSIEDLISQLMAAGVKCYEVHGTCGLHGFVFAGSMKVRSRRSRAGVAEVECSNTSVE